MRTLAFVVLLLLPSAALAEVTGPALVGDADTMTVNGEHVSLYGIDALEITQSCEINDETWFCGWDAANRLEEVIGERDVTCTPADAANDDGEALYRCMAGDDDLAVILLDEGFAVVAEDTDDLYREREMAASEAGAGIWAGTFVQPSLHRANEACGCTARKQAMMETAAMLREKRAAEEAAAAEEATN
jgi:endonuclease YncB( thermonuclease family)